MFGADESFGGLPLGVDVGGKLGKWARQPAAIA